MKVHLAKVKLDLIQTSGGGGGGMGGGRGGEGGEGGPGQNNSFRPTAFHL